jgi:hypothetical protein
MLSRAWVVIIDRLFGHILLTQIIDAKYLFNADGCRPTPFVCLYPACTYANTSDPVLATSPSRPSTPTPVLLPAAHAASRNDRVLC